MTPLDVLLNIVIAFVAGAVGAFLVEWRFWLEFADDVRRHGLDNHLCNKAGCCR